MIKDIKSDYVMIWIEDHINMVDVSVYDEILNEMASQKCQHLVYTWWNNNYKKKFKSIKSTESKNLIFYEINKNNIETIHHNTNKHFYIISLASIISFSLFNKIIHTNHPKLKRWSKKLPFDFEKRSTDIDFIPLKHCISKFELFASIDDDHGSPGYSLISRELYPNRLTRMQMRKIERTKINFNSLLKYIPGTFFKKILQSIYMFIKRVIYTIT